VAVGQQQLLVLLEKLAVLAAALVVTIITLLLLVLEQQDKVMAVEGILQMPLKAVVAAAVLVVPEQMVGLVEALVGQELLRQLLVQA
jgi:hypothetical protein